MRGPELALFASNPTLSTGMCSVVVTVGLPFRIQGICKDGGRPRSPRIIRVATDAVSGVTSVRAVFASTSVPGRRISAIISVCRAVHGNVGVPGAFAIFAAKPQCSIVQTTHKAFGIIGDSTMSQTRMYASRGTVHDARTVPGLLRSSLGDVEAVAIDLQRLQLPCPLQAGLEREVETGISSRTPQASGFPFQRDSHGSFPLYR
jgi:hypothetical protein